MSRLEASWGSPRRSNKSHKSNTSTRKSSTKGTGGRKEHVSPMDPAEAMPWMKMVNEMVKADNGSTAEGIASATQEGEGEGDVEERVEAAPAIVSDSRKVVQRQVDDLLARLDATVSRQSTRALKDELRRMGVDSSGCSDQNALEQLYSQAKLSKTHTDISTDADAASSYQSQKQRPIAKRKVDADADATGRGYGDNPVADSMPPNAPVALLGMQLVLHGDQPPHQPQRYGVRPEAPMPLQDMRMMLQAMEQPHRSEELVEKLNAIRSADAAKPKPTRKVRASYEPATTYSDWVGDKHVLTREGTLSNPPSSMDRDREKRRAQERVHEKQQRKLELQLEADEAKVAYGASTLELENKKRREEKRAENEFQRDQQMGLALFQRRTPRNLMINLIAAAAQAFLIITVMFSRDSKDPDENGDGGRSPRNPSPQSVILFAFAGVTGSVINIVCLFTVFSVIRLRGLGARSLPAVAKVVVWLQYLSKACQSFSLISFMLYLEVLPPSPPPPLAPSRAHKPIRPCTHS